MKTEVFAERLRQGLELRQLSGNQLGVLCGIGKGTISEYLSGQYGPKSERLEKLAQALGCDPRWLAGGDVPMVPAQDSCAAAAGDCMLEVCLHPEADGSEAVYAKRSAPPEFCDGRHFWLMAETDICRNAFLLCRRQGVLLGGQTGVLLDSDAQVLIVRCEQRRDVTCFAELWGKRRIFINDETADLRVVARVVQWVCDC